MPVLVPEGGMSTEATEVLLLRQALKRVPGDKIRAAALLGLTRDMLLFYRLKRMAPRCEHPGI